MVNVLNQIIVTFDSPSHLQNILFIFVILHCIKKILSFLATVLEYNTVELLRL